MKKFMFTFLLAVSFCKSAHISKSWAQAVQKYPNIKQEEILYLNDNLITEIPNGLKLPKLKALCLEGNKITTIDNLSLSNLKSLHLENNNINSINNPNLHNLQMLFLSNNHINSIDNLNLDNLKMLFLANNHIASIDSQKILKQLPRLSFLVLIQNPLSRNNVDELSNAATAIGRELTIIADDTKNEKYLRSGIVIKPTKRYLNNHKHIFSEAEKPSLIGPAPRLMLY